MRIKLTWLKGKHPNLSAERLLYLIETLTKLGWVQHFQALHAAVRASEVKRKAMILQLSFLLKQPITCVVRVCELSWTEGCQMSTKVKAFVAPSSLTLYWFCLPASSLSLNSPVWNLLSTKIAGSAKNLHFTVQWGGACERMYDTAFNQIS